MVACAREITNPFFIAILRHWYLAEKIDPQHMNDACLNMKLFIFNTSYNS